MNKSLDEIIVEAVRQHSLGPLHSRTATCWPLSASGAWNDRDWWYGKEVAKAKSRHGNPSMTTALNNEAIVTVMCSNKGKNPIVFVRDDVEVVTYPASK